MSKHNRRELRPRNGHTLVVGIVARISGCQNQKELSLEDQVDHAKQVVAELYDGPIEYVEIATRGKGERLDRPELGDVEQILRSRRLDVLVAEDLGRLVRGVTAAWLCGIAVDHGVRVFAPNDGIDTAEENWEEEVIQACRDHVGHNSHVSKRIKQKLMNRFEKFGGATAREVWGYCKPRAHAPYTEWTLSEGAAEVYKEWFRLLRETRNYQAVADWLNEKGIPTGPYCRNKIWDGRMVSRVTHNSILKGMPSRGGRHSVKHNESGRRLSVKNPDGPTHFHCPHLAAIDADEWDAVNYMMRVENAGCGRKPVDGRDPRSGVPRKGTVWPGQHILCGLCGRFFVWGGHGQTTHMMCAGVRDKQCWAAMTFDGIEAAGRIGQIVLAAIEQVAGFDETFVGRTRANADRARSVREEADRRLTSDELDIRGRLARMLDFIEKRGESEASAQRVRELEGRLSAIKLERLEIRSRPEELPPLPSVEELKVIARERLGTLAVNDQEFGRVMRQLMPRILVFPFRAVDSDWLVARCLVTLDLAGLMSSGLAEASGGVLRQEVWVDLHDRPQRVANREKVVALRASGLKQREVAKELGMTQPIVQQALALDGKMAAQGLTDPYLLVSAPLDAKRYTGHLHPRYRFEPLDGFPAWPTMPTD